MINKSTKSNFELEHNCSLKLWMHYVWMKSKWLTQEFVLANNHEFLSQSQPLTMCLMLPLNAYCQCHYHPLHLLRACFQSISWGTLLYALFLVMTVCCCTCHTRDSGACLPATNCSAQLSTDDPWNVCCAVMIPKSMLRTECWRFFQFSFLRHTMEMHYIEILFPELKPQWCFIQTTS